MQPIGELDDDDARVPRHGHQQLPVILRLLFGGRPEGERRDFGEAVDQVGDFVAEVTPQDLEGDVGILDDVVQQSGRNRRRVHLLLGKNCGDGDAVRHEVVARHALLTLMRLRAQAVGA